MAILIFANNVVSLPPHPTFWRAYFRMNDKTIFSLGAAQRRKTTPQFPFHNQKLNGYG
jgi:hypothetical protein